METAVTARGSCITLVFDFPGMLSVEEKACEAHAQRLTKDRFTKIRDRGRIGGQTLRWGVGVY